MHSVQAIITSDSLETLPFVVPLQECRLLGFSVLKCAYIYCCSAKFCKQNPVISIRICKFHEAEKVPHVDFASF